MASQRGVRTFARARWLATAPLVAGLVSACGAGSETGVAARAGDWTLGEAGLADLLVLAQPFPLTADAAEELTRHWIAVSALARRFAAGDSLTDTGTTRASTWLERREALLALEREVRLGANVAVDVAEAAAAFREGTYRLVAHVLRRIGPETSASERELQRRTAERILAALVAGGSWEAAVAESEDEATRAASGLLGLLAPGELEPALDRAAFGLAPGRASSLVTGARGYHILYRPRFDEVAELYAARLRERRLAVADAAASAALLAEREPRFAPTAATTVRDLAESPWDGLGSETVLASWEGGGLREGVAARYVLALPAASRAEMAVAPDEALRSFLEELVVREMRLADAARHGLVLDEGFLAGLAEQHAAEMRDWREALGLVGAGDPRATADAHMEALVARRATAPTLAPSLEAHLLEGTEWEVVPVGIQAAVARARAMVEAAGGGAEDPDSSR